METEQKRRKRHPKNVNSNKSRPTYEQTDLIKELSKYSLPQSEIDFIVFGLPPKNVNLPNLLEKNEKVGFKRLLLRILELSLPQYLEKLSENPKLQGLDADSHDSFYYSIIQIFKQVYEKGQLDTRSAKWERVFADAWHETEYIRHDFKTRVKNPQARDKTKKRILNFIQSSKNSTEVAIAVKKLEAWEDYIENDDLNLPIVNQLKSDLDALLTISKDNKCSERTKNELAEIFLSKNLSDILNAKKAVQTILEKASLHFLNEKVEFDY